MRVHLIAAVVLAASMAFPSASLFSRPTSGVTNPQIAFVKSSTSGRRQLMVANEDGSGATAIYTTNQLVRVEMGSDGMVYFWDGPRFGKIPVSGGSPQWLFEVSSRFGATSDLSPDGSSLAWFSAESGGIFRYSIATGQQLPVAVVASVLDLSFDRTGANIIFSTPVSDVDYELRIVPARQVR